MSANKKRKRNKAGWSRLKKEKNKARKEEGEKERGNKRMQGREKLEKIFALSRV